MKNTDIVFPSSQLRYVHDSLIEIVRKAGKTLLKYYYSDFKIHHKGTYDLVTEADLASEKIINTSLQKLTPKIKIVSEEATDEQHLLSTFENETYWLVDPLDGTTNFAHRLPHFSVSVALLKKNRSILGVVYDPIKNEMFSAIKNKGCFYNNRKCFVSQTKTLSNSLLATGFPYKIKELKNDNNLLNFCVFRLNTQGVRRLGSAALDLAYVSNGRLDGFWEQWLKPWDVAAGLLLVEEAGGETSDFWGFPYKLGGSGIVASNKHIHEQMIDILKKQKPQRLAFLYE